MTVSFTPGPWEYVPKLSGSENHKGFFIRAEKTTRNGKWSLAEVQPGDEDGNLGEANARLIAAAPDLLAALVAFRDGGPNGGNNFKGWHRGYDAAIALAYAALAKATGISSNTPPDPTAASLPAAGGAFFNEVG